MNKEKIENFFDNLERTIGLIFSIILLLIFILLLIIVKGIKQKIFLLPFILLSISFILSYLNINKKYYIFLKIISIICILLLIASMYI